MALWILSGIIWVRQYQKGKTNLFFFSEARDRVAVVSAGPYTYMHLTQTDNHTSSQTLSFLQAGCLSCSPTNSVKVLKALHCYWKLH